MMKMFIFVLVMFFSSSCTDMPNAKAEAGLITSNFFEDINISNLEGLNKLKDFSYPCIEIRKESNKTIVTYHVSPGEKHTEEYELEKGVWSSISEEESPYGKLSIYRFVFQDSCIEFSYIDKDHNKLYDARVIKNNEEYAYLNFDDFSFRPQYKNLSIAIKNSKLKHLHTLTFKDSMLMSARKTFDENGVIKLNKTACYNSKPRSYTWFSYFSAHLKKVDCN